ncbi:MAG TPA: WD40 repeat domain-containing protein [Gemmataceae bacterium]|jgi:WD40 repeat protein
MSDELIRTWLKLPPEPWPPDPRTLLGLEPGESDVKRIEAHAQERMEQVRHYQWAHPEEVTEAMSWLARAVMSLTNPIPQGTAEASQSTALPPARLKTTSELPDEDSDPDHEDSVPDHTGEFHPRRVAPGTWLIGIVAAIVIAVCGIIFGIKLYNQQTAAVIPEESIPELRRAAVFPEGATCLAFSPDGRRALSGGIGVLRVWDVEKEKVVHRLQGHTGPVLCTAFTPDGRRCVSGGSDRTIHLWDLESREEKGRFEGHTGPVLCLAVSADGGRFLSGSEDKTIRLWKLEEKGEPVCLTGHTGPVTGIAFAAEDRQALSWSRDHSLRFWDLDKGREQRRRSGDLWEGPSSALSADGRYTLAVDGERVRVADVEGGRAPRSFLVQPGPVTCVTLSGDGRRLLVGGEDGTVHVFDVESGQEVCRCLGHKKPVTCAALSPNGRRALTASSDQTTRLWELP